MSGGSSSAGRWFTPPTAAREGLPQRPDDPRLGNVTAAWDGDAAALRRGRPVLLGFPCDEGVRRNGGRPGAAQGPAAIRHWLYRLGAADPDSGAELSGLLDVGDLIVSGDLEGSQAVLGKVVVELLEQGCVPVVLGGGHETAYGTFLGYVGAISEVAVINVDAHLDVRPLLRGLGHSGSPFRQMMEHRALPLQGSRYVCLGAQPANTSAEHVRYLRERGGEVVWADAVRSRLAEQFTRWRERVTVSGCPLHVSLDADVVRATDVPGVSAPAPLGLCGVEVAAWARRAGADTAVSSFEVVEINPAFDVDGRSARWAAAVVWQFLVGLASRPVGSEARP
jgi:formiminoglutamase